MLQSFHEWRVAKMHAAETSGMHYYRVDLAVWLDVRSLLQSLLSRRVSSGANRFRLSLTDTQLDTILLFLQQMQCGYMHPRSTSARYQYAQAIRTANPLT